MWCADSRTPQGASARVRERIHACGAASFAPFRLVVIAPAHPALLVHWDGRALAESEPGAFLTSSSREPGRIEATRIRARESLGHGCTSERLEAFHRHHDPLRGAESVCMHREDACTRSLCHVRARLGERPSLRHTGLLWPGPRFGDTAEEFL
jgi:hypothetical protein